MQYKVVTDKNTYEFETQSEALVKLSAFKLLGIKARFVRPEDEEIVIVTID